MSFVLYYDKSFGGILSAIFYAFRHRCFQARLLPQQEEAPSLFGESVSITSNETEARRVWTGIEQLTSYQEANWLFRASLADLPEIHQAIFQYICQLFQEKQSLKNMEHLSYVREIHRANKLVFREEHRMHAFVRFSKTANGQFIAPIAPRHDVLPLLGSFFTARYADQDWLIYDLCRNKGISFQDAVLTEVQLSKLPASWQLQDAATEDYPQLWEAYYQSVNIPERYNPKLHLQHIPKSYWWMLPELKQYRAELPGQPLRPSASLHSVNHLTNDHHT